MKTKFEHVALHYVGSEIRVELKSKIFGSNECEVIFQGIDFSTAIVPHYRLVAYYPNLKDCTHSESLWLDGNYFKPILRPLSDMQPKEAEEYFKIENSRDGVSGFVSAKGNILVNWYNDNGWGTTTADGNEMIVKQNKLIKNPSANQFVYLLSKHFDLFGLIESGEAVDKTKL